jgi:hypothetical protein
LANARRFGEIVLYAHAGKDDDPDLQQFQHGVVSLERHTLRLAGGQPVVARAK